MISLKHKQKLKSFSAEMLEIECSYQNLKELTPIFFNLAQINNTKAQELQKTLEQELNCLEQGLLLIKNLIIGAEDESIC